MKKDVNEFLKVVIDDLASEVEGSPMELLEIFERGFNNQNINIDALNNIEKKAYELGQMASQYDDPDEFSADYREDRLTESESKLVEAIEITGDNIVRCENAFDSVYSDDLSSPNLSKKDIFEAFKAGYFDEEIPEQEYLGMSDEDYEKYLLAYSFGLKINPNIK